MTKRADQNNALPGIMDNRVPEHDNARIQIRRYGRIHRELARTPEDALDLEFHVSIVRDTPGGRKVLFTDLVGAYVFKTTEHGESVYTLKINSTSVVPGDYVLVVASRPYDRSTEWDTTETSLSVIPAPVVQEHHD